ncbi:MAG TPA: DUF4325 domain-containing protein [Bacteroidetes bacterium]|nr:hypothetical protein BMS3Bbin04_00816 [bacterium BMS3Bbin04]HDO65692.1 DUF4325 domain-containing protein [Bacteroidota bacterium]HEX04817.1 DUF4325 domain-containing protein [Bacteroidota bacterium]
MLIKVKSLVGTSVSSRKDGRKLRRKILDTLANSQESVIVDFGGMEIASVSFLDEGIALLLEDITIEEMGKKVKVINIDELDRKLLNFITLSRKKERDTLQQGE